MLGEKCSPLRRVALESRSPPTPPCPGRPRKRLHPHLMVLSLRDIRSRTPFRASPWARMNVGHTASAKRADETLWRTNSLIGDSRGRRSPIWLGLDSFRSRDGDLRGRGQILANPGEQNHRRGYGLRGDLRGVAEVPSLTRWTRRACWGNGRWLSDPATTRLFAHRPQSLLPTTSGRASEPLCERP